MVVSVKVRGQPEAVSLFAMWILRDETQVARIRGWGIHLLSHLASPPQRQQGYKDKRKEEIWV